MAACGSQGPEPQPAARRVGTSRSARLRRRSVAGAGPARPRTCGWWRPSAWLP